MFEQFNYLKNELIEIVNRHMEKEGSQITEIPFLSLSRYSTSHYSTVAGPPYQIYNPSIGILIQGSKDVILGGNRYRYGAMNYLVVSMDLPIMFEVLEATKEVPNLACKIDIKPEDILKLLNDEEVKYNLNKALKHECNADKLDISMLDPLVRLVRLLDKPEDIKVLAPLYQTEILYQILRSKQGEALKLFAFDGSTTMHIKNAIQYILNNFQDSFLIEDLAKKSNMSVPSFYRHFKQITDMSPIQFQKQIRLQEARRQIISESIDVAEVAYRVG